MRYAVMVSLAVAIGAGCLAVASAGEGAAGPSMMKAPIDYANHPLKTWVKRTPGPDAPPNPKMGYETSYGWDPERKIMIRWGGHNQGGGGEQNAETWHYDPVANTWTLAVVNTCPPGNCCCRENVFDPAHGRFVRFPAFFNSHGWHWLRTGYTRDSSVWQYDPGTKTWRNMRPLPEPSPKPMRGAVWDSDDQVILLTAGENAGHGTQVYDPHTNRWTAMKPAQELPQDRNTFGITYDSKRKCFYAFGDQYGRDQRTWKYDLKSNTWTDLKPEHHPAKAQDGTAMVYDPVNDVVVANLRQGTEGGTEDKPAGQRETWIYHPDKNDWEKLDTGKDVDFSGSRNTVMVYAPELNVILMENRTLEMQMWTFRYAAGAKDERPATPTDLAVKTVAAGATLTWKGPAKAFAVYRGTGEKPWTVEFKKVKEVVAGATSFADTDMTKGTVYYYYVAAVDDKGRESAPSIKVRTQPWVVQDVVVSPVEAKKLELEWPAPGADVVSYRVDRADVKVYSMSELKNMEYKGPSTRLATAVGAIRAIGPFATIAKDVKEPRFTDTTADFAAGQKDVTGTPVYQRDLERSRDPAGKAYPWAVYAYRVYATNALGVESGDSPWFLSIPGAVESVMSREHDAGQVDIRWAAHKAKGVVGYNVYRMWDRFNASTRFELLNPKPVAATTFTDAKAGMNAHFYFVAAVDALGQEGLISSPTWGYRDYARFYKPFIAEWHQ